MIMDMLARGQAMKMTIRYTVKVNRRLRQRQDFLGGLGARGSGAWGWGSRLGGSGSGAFARRATP